MEKNKRQPCEVFSRVCGYMRPVSSWNDAKQQEFLDRKLFKINESQCEAHQDKK